MKWAKRGLWMAAWGAWVWAGFGLQHNLPRRLAPPIQHIKLSQIEQVRGFIDARRVLVGQRGSFIFRGDPERRYDLYDALTGDLEGEIRLRFSEVRSLVSPALWFDKNATRYLEFDWIVDAAPFLIPSGWFTVAIRDNPDGVLVMRLWFVDSTVLSHCSPDGTLWSCSNGDIYASPIVNYPLLALCQTILATPLVLLWAVLRWRSKRRLRLASVTP